MLCSPSRSLASDAAQWRSRAARISWLSTPDLLDHRRRCRSSRAALGRCLPYLSLTTRAPPELTAAVAAGSGVRLYVILLGAQCAGDLGILLHVIPIYRRFLTGVVDQRADLSTFAWAAASVVVIQVAYWWSTLKVFPTLSIRPHLFFG